MVILRSSFVMNIFLFFQVLHSVVAARCSGFDYFCAAVVFVQLEDYELGEVFHDLLVCIGGVIVGGVSRFYAVELFESFLHVVVGFFGDVVESPSTLVIGVHGDEPVVFFLPGTVGDNEVEGFAVFFSDFEYGLLYGFVPKLGFDAPMDDD